MNRQKAVPLAQFFVNDLHSIREYCRHLGDLHHVTTNVEATSEATSEANKAAPSQVKVVETQLVMHNDASEPACFREVTLFNIKLKAASPIYMEGYQMLSQTTGTVAQPVAIGRIDEIRDYSLYQGSKGAVCGSNLFMVKEGGLWYLIGATSAFRTDIQFQLKDEELQVLWDLNGTNLDGNCSYESDYIAFISGPERSEVLAAMAKLINSHHPQRLSSRKTGWCSWYCYYADITESIVRQNLDLMVKDFPEPADLEYVQIDDGYQTAMGDWLSESNKFESGLKKLCADIKAKGRKPAIWLAPFIADGNSEVFKQHPSWFIHDANGQPVEAGNLTFGGWRCTPWYLLDMTQNEVRSRIKHVCEVMRRDYGIDYFKLDACYWGAIRGLKYRHEVTAIAHYRLGLSAIRQGAGEDAYLLGCNAPFWPSFGLVEAQRVTDDVDRTPERVRQISREFRYRAWMGETLWQNDVDCLVTRPLPGGQDLAPGFFRILLGLALTAAGPVLIGDDMARVCLTNGLVDARGSGAQLTVLDALQRKVAAPARFTGDNLDTAWLKLTTGAEWKLTFTDDDVIAEKLS